MIRGQEFSEAMRVALMGEEIEHREVKGNNMIGKVFVYSPFTCEQSTGFYAAF